jgi:hypothetical protein
MGSSYGLIEKSQTDINKPDIDSDGLGDGDEVTATARKLLLAGGP